MTSLRHLGPLGMSMLVMLLAQAGLASDPADLPQSLAGASATIAAAAEAAGGEAGERQTAGPGPEGTTTSPLLRSLSDRPAEAQARDVAISGGAGPSADAHPMDGVLFGCPRTLLAALLTEAVETGDAVSALAIERETLALCRERQEIVTGIVTLEGELRAILKESPREQAVAAASAHTPIVKESTPVRVVSLAPAPVDGGGATAPEETAPPAPPASPAYAWFSIIGTAGDLQAGVSDGSRVWFVREGDRLPGAVTVTRIVARPPGVRIGSDGKDALPYGPRPAGASQGEWP